jgi:hypothetical protein
MLGRWSPFEAIVLHTPVRPSHLYLIARRYPRVLRQPLATIIPCSQNAMIMSLNTFLSLLHQSQPEFLRLLDTDWELRDVRYDFVVYFRWKRSLF